MVNISKLRDPRTRENWYASGAVAALPRTQADGYVYWHTLAVQAKRRGHEDDAEHFEKCALARDEFERLDLLCDHLDREAAKRHSEQTCDKDCSLCADERYSYKAAGHYENITCPDCGEVGRVGPGSTECFLYCYNCCSQF